MKEEVIKNLSLDQFKHTFDQLVELMVSNAYIYYDYLFDTDTRKTRQIEWGFSDEDLIDLLGDFINDSDYSVDATAFYEEYGEEARIEAERLIFEAEED
jgi:hypothetical protein